MLPTVKEYTRLLHQATQKFEITISEARNRYGLYTIEQWNNLLK